VSSSDHHRVEHPEVGVAGVEQGPDPEVLEVGDPEADALGAFQTVVHALWDGSTPSLRATRGSERTRRCVHGHTRARVRKGRRQACTTIRSPPSREIVAVHQLGPQQARLDA